MILAATTLLFFGAVFREFAFADIDWQWEPFGNCFNGNTNTTKPFRACYAWQCDCALCTKRNDTSSENTFCIIYTANSTVWNCPERNLSDYQSCLSRAETSRYVSLFAFLGGLAIVCILILFISFHQVCRPRKQTQYFPLPSAK